MELKPPVGGACVAKATSIFFPDPRTRSITKEMQEAIALCNGCRVKTPCLQYALHHELHGIWGGMTEGQRKVLRKELQIRVVTPGYVDPAATRIKQ